MNSQTAKVVVITGAGSGIGKALAATYAERGAFLSLCARNTDNLKTVADELSSQYGAKVFTFKADVAEKSECKAFIDATIQQFGRIDVLINNAGISMRALLVDADPEVIERVMQVNFFGTLYCTKYALPKIIEHKGSIVGISSIAGYRGLPGRTGYSASKFAMNGFLEALRTELLETGVHVLIACPGFTRSNIRKTALSADGSAQGESPRNEEKMMSAEEVALAIALAVDQKKKTLILTGQGKLTVFLNKWLSGPMDRMVFNHFRKEEDSPLK